MLGIIYKKNVEYDLQEWQVWFTNMFRTIYKTESAC